MRGSHTFLVVKGSGKPGRCRFCRHAIVWALAITKKGARTLPFTKEPMYAAEVRAENGVRYEQWPSDLLHLANCTHLPQRAGARG